MVQGGAGENSSKMKTAFFLRGSSYGEKLGLLCCRLPPARNKDDFFLAMARNLHRLARICTFWWDMSGRGENSWVWELDFFLPRGPRRRNISSNSSLESCPSTNIASQRALVCTVMTRKVAFDEWHFRWIHQLPFCFDYLDNYSLSCHVSILSKFFRLNRQSS